MSRRLYPKIKCNQSLFLPVGDDHELYVEECGNVAGIPVIFLHGGPGSGCVADHRRYFDPEKYRIILFDQRGCGRSKPFSKTEHNTTADLLADIEKIRAHFDIKRWLVFGGSWGATLALLYAIKYKPYVSGLILRGVFLATKIESDWLFNQGGVSEFYPEYFAEYIEPISYQVGDDIPAKYHQLLMSENELVRLSAAVQWSLWEERLVSFDTINYDHKAHLNTHHAIGRSHVSNHYAVNKYFIEENYILKNHAILADIPTTIVHGRFDMICRLSASTQLANALPNAKLFIVPHAGHSGFDKGIVDALVNATDAMASFLAAKVDEPT